MFCGCAAAVCYFRGAELGVLYGTATGKQQQRQGMCVPCVRYPNTSLHSQ